MLGFSTPRSKSMIREAWENIGFGYQHEPEYSNSWGLMNNRKMRKDASNKMEKFDVRPSNIKLKVRNFSGGNQQKLVLAAASHDPPLAISLYPYFPTLPYILYIPNRALM